jgi:hypothetical protein
MKSKSARVKPASFPERGAAPKVKTASRSGQLRAKLLLLFFSILLSIGLSEVALRMFFRDTFSQAEDERSLTYRYDAELGWFPMANSKKLFTASRTITAAHNSQGFRGPELAKSNKPRFIFLGDSLVWGFDVEASERFTEKLQAKHPEWAVYNFGVSGYGTDQEYLLLQKYFDEYAPSVVFLMICGDNDNEDNSWNFRGGYYKPWYTLEGGGLRVNGVPVPKAEKVFFSEHKFLCRSYVVRLFVRAYCKFTTPPPRKQADPPTGVILLDMRRYVVDRRAFFAVGLQHSHPDLTKFLQDYEIPYVALDATNSSQIYPEFWNHWTPEGHAFVAEKIDELLRRR